MGAENGGEEYGGGENPEEEKGTLERQPPEDPGADTGAL
jgi:hypothetical protein